MAFTLLAVPCTIEPLSRRFESQVAIASSKVSFTEFIPRGIRIAVQRENGANAAAIATGHRARVADCHLRVRRVAARSMLEETLPRATQHSVIKPISSSALDSETWPFPFGYSMEVSSTRGSCETCENRQGISGTLTELAFPGTRNFVNVPEIKRRIGRMADLNALYIPAPY